MTDLSVPSRPGRSVAVDVWRGVVLCTIFVNHVPGTVFERLTYRNFGFSDSAEAFVFISGLAVAMAYGRALRTGAAGTILAGLSRRTAKLYAVHLGLSAVGVAIFALGAAAFPDAGLMDQHGRDLVGEDPGAALLGLVSLGHQFGYFNILPLYIVLVAFAPVQLLLARRSVPLMLGASAALYAFARVEDINVPTWPMRGEWFLNPFAWQLLMAIGIACGLSVGGSRRSASPLLLAAAGAVLVASAFCATDGFGNWPGLFDTMRADADLDKTNLGLGRLVHFLCLGYLVARLPALSALAAHRWARPLARLGRHGLPAFVGLSLLAAVGQVLTGGLGHVPFLDALIVGGGLLLLLLAPPVAEAIARRRVGAPYRELSAPGRTTL